MQSIMNIIHKKESFLQFYALYGTFFYILRLNSNNTEGGHLMKKFISLLVLVTVVLSVAGCGVSAAYLEREEIPVMLETDATAQGLVKLGILKGTGESLELVRNITRAEAVALIFRIHYESIGAIGMPSPEFSDLDGHWAYKEVTAAKKIGIVEGVGDGRFEPDRVVTGKEFAKMLMSTLGYTDVTIDNVYDKAIDAELLMNNYAKSVVAGNMTLLRGDAARLLWGMFLARTPEGSMYKERLVHSGKFREENFNGTLYVGCGTPAAINPDFVDKINAQMPDDKNYMFSPLSIQMAFMMAANGATGETLDEILKALEISDKNEYNEMAKALISEYRNSGAVEINIANAIWMNEDNADFVFDKSYTDLLNEYFEAEASISDNKKIVNEVNNWVNDKTKGKIPTIINDPYFTAVLLNAIYFKGAWADEFPEHATSSRNFTDRNGKCHSIDFMNKTDSINYFKDEFIEVLELPYRNYTYNEKNDEFKRYDTDISMYLVRNRFEYEDEMLTKCIEENKLTSTYMNFSMPKFCVEYSAGISDVMKNLGINKAFDKRYADFTKMVTGGNMYITDAIHKTYISVDEKGTEAAAVTAVMMDATSAMRPEPIKVSFDTPFTFVIRDNKNGITLFIGEYAFTE